MNKQENPLTLKHNDQSFNDDEMADVFRSVFIK